MSWSRECELSALAGYAFEDRTEADVRADWIDPLLRLLGYGLGTRNRVRREVPLQLDPPLRRIGSHSIRVDYIPTVSELGLWIIEAKRPQDDLFNDDHLGQAWSYATDPRVRVPLIMLCDGERLGVFDVTQPNWDLPVLDISRSELPDRFDELDAVLGARNVAEAVRVRQLDYLRVALNAQLDTQSLDATLSAVKTMVDETRPVIDAKRKQIRDEARRQSLESSEAIIDRSGVEALVQELNGPPGFTFNDLARATGLIRRESPERRISEFDRMSTPVPERAWFTVRVLQMAVAVSLSQDEACGAHCESVARRLASQIANGFGDDPLLEATYELQRQLGPWGWRVAATNKAASEATAAELARRLDAEDWLRLDGQIGITLGDLYERTARLAPRMLLNAIKPWDVETLARHADLVRKLVDSAPPITDHHLQPAGDRGLDSWRDRDPAKDYALASLQRIAGTDETPEPVRLLARELEALVAGDT